MVFSERYPLEPPEVTFVPPSPVHPHIYSNGHICLGGRRWGCVCVRVCASADGGGGCVGDPSVCVLWTATAQRISAARQDAAWAEGGACGSGPVQLLGLHGSAGSGRGGARCAPDMPPERLPPHPADILYDGQNGGWSPALTISKVRGCGNGWCLRHVNCQQQLRASGHDRQRKASQACVSCWFMT